MAKQINQSLTEDQKAVLLNAQTEAPFTGELLENKEKGVYVCANCGNKIFESGTKFDSKSGWPSFYDVIAQDTVMLIDDISHGMRRTEVVCGNCEGHLGHLFNDGPSETTGMRYCINSLSLDFKAEQNSNASSTEGKS